MKMTQTTIDLIMSEVGVPSGGSMKFSQLAYFFVLFCHHSHTERPDFFGDFPFARENITFY
jgi:hypothetical protein